MSADRDDDSIRQTTFTFHADAIKRADAAAEDDARLIWLMLAFIRTRQVGFAHYFGVFQRSERTFKRDIHKLRELGKRYEFELTPQRQKVVRLVRFDDGKRASATDASGRDALQALTDAFGEVLAASLRGVVDIEATSLDRFLRIATPRLTSTSGVAATYRESRGAWQAKARLRFRYPARDGSRPAERIVEPYAVTYHAGRYYLVAFDTRPKSGGWRQFALDRMIGPFRRAGTFAPRIVPQHYRGEDAIGLFKTGSRSEITVELSASIADAVLARRWQRGERIVRRADGSATIAFALYDVDEAIRWAMSFGTEARVVAPPPAVDAARRMAERAFRAYERAETSATGATSAS